jgi:hypothetical protein
MRAIERTAFFDETGQMRIENLPLLKNQKVKLIILVEDNEEKDLYALSSQSLSNAYSKEEPDYNLSLLNEPNPNYEGR